MINAKMKEARSNVALCAEAPETRKCVRKRQK